MLQITLPDEEVVPSMALAVTRRFCDYMGQGEVKLPPTDSRRKNTDARLEANAPAGTI